MSPQRHQFQHFSDRRFKVFEKMGQGACLIPTNHKITRNGDAEYAYRQHSDFHYLTGWPEDGALLVLLSKENEQKSILFCTESSELEAKWNGARIGPIAAKKEFGLDETYHLDEVDTLLPQMLSGCDKLYYPMGLDAAFESNLRESLDKINRFKRKGWVAPKHHIELSQLLDELRLFKMGDEVGCMRKAASISAKAHKQAMIAVHAGMFEYELEAEYRYSFLKQGAQDVAYLPIVAAGHNACVLHYTANNQPIKDGDLVLVDAGCEYEGYASDITRTFPANGKFTKEQQAIYEIVLESQNKAIEIAVDGNPWGMMQEVILNVLVQGLVDLKLLKGNVKSLIEQEAYMPYYMHSSGHWLGLDVHDVGDYKVDGQWRALKPGMMLTIEPGLYLPYDDQNLPEGYRGIGVRIEDDILVTDNKADILSSEAPKTISDIEQLMKK